MTVKGEFDQERLMRGVVEASPAMARLRERVRGVPEAAAYYDRIRLGQLIADEVEDARERCSARVFERLEPLAAAASRERISSIHAAVNAAFLSRRIPSRTSGPPRTELQREFAGRGAAALRRAAAAVQLLGHRTLSRGPRRGPDHGLITLPLAPVRATAWIAEQVLEQAEAEYYGEERVQRAPRRGRRARAAGRARCRRRRPASRTS